MATMGAHGQGSIGKRRKDGRIPVSILIGGQRVYRMVPAMKDGRAQRRLAERYRRELIDLRLADLNPSGQTLEAYLRSWLAGQRDARIQRLRPRTLDFYAAIVDQRIVPALGHHRLDKLSERHVQAWLDRERGSARSIHHYRAVLRRALNVAVKHRVIARNPALAVELPAADDFEGDPLSIEEARQLLANLSSSDRLGALWRLAIITGLRQGELLGLGWDDVDLEEGVIRIAGQLQRRAGSWIRTPPKAGRALPAIAIDPATAAVLAAHRLRQAGARQPDWEYWGLVFVTPRGQPFGRSEILRAFHGACDAAGIRRRRFHDLRHTSNHLLEDLGVPEPVRQARFGWTTTRMPRRYGGPSAVQDRVAVTALAEAIG